MNFDDIRLKIIKAIKIFWEKRADGDGVKSGKTLDPFIDLIKEVVLDAFPEAKVYVKKGETAIPGYFRPFKNWDMLIMCPKKNTPVAIIELKSQVGSIGNNFNNRVEEALGSSFDVMMAVKNETFKEAPSHFFRGYFMLFGDVGKIDETTFIDMKFFKPDEIFLVEQKKSGKRYKGVSYIKRYNILCKRLMSQRLYDAAAVMVAQKDGFKDIEQETSFIVFLQKLHSHCILWEKMC